MSYLHSLILGIIQGATEFLPISSTAHLILSSQLLKIDQTDFLKTFEIVIQLGSILAVVWLYWRKFLNFEVLKRLLVAFIPTGILGLILYKIVKNFFFESNGLITGALIIGGLLIIIFEIVHNKQKESDQEIEKIPYSTCAWLGVFQSFAMIPGVSRSAATIIGGLLMGMKRKTIAEFSFMLAVPTMIAASGYDMYKNRATLNFDNSMALIIGFIGAFIVAILAIKFLMKYIKTHDFKIFGWYRIAIGVLFLFLLVI